MGGRIANAEDISLFDHSKVGLIVNHDAERMCAIIAATETPTWIGFTRQFGITNARSGE